MKKWLIFYLMFLLFLFYAVAYGQPAAAQDQLSAGVWYNVVPVPEAGGSWWGWGVVNQDSRGNIGNFGIHGMTISASGISIQQQDGWWCWTVGPDGTWPSSDGKTSIQCLAYPGRELWNNQGVFFWAFVCCMTGQTEGGWVAVGNALAGWGPIAVPSW